MKNLEKSETTSLDRQLGPVAMLLTAVTSIIGSMLQAEQLGTPLSGVFRTQADVLRMKRSQRAEAIAGEAAVKMLLPGVLVMAATVIVIIGPFALNFLIFG